jgi:DNA-binding SARP family transcriptional activator
MQVSSKHEAGHAAALWLVVALAAGVGCTVVMLRLLVGPGRAAADLVTLLSHPPKRIDDAQVREITSAACWIALSGFVAVAIGSRRLARPAWLATSGPVSARMHLQGVATEGGRSTRLARRPAGPPQPPQINRRAEMPRHQEPESATDYSLLDPPPNAQVPHDATPARAAPVAEHPAHNSRSPRIESSASFLDRGSAFAPTGPHLEAPEWSRALLGLASRSGTAARLPLVWRFGPEEILAFCPRQSTPPEPFTSSGGTPGWRLPRDSRLLDSLDSQAIIRASLRAGLVTLSNVGAERCLLDVIAAGTVALDGPPVAIGYTLSDVVVELASRRWSDLEEVWLVGFGREMHGLENVRYLPSIPEAASLLANLDQLGDTRSRCFVVAPALEETERAPIRSFLRLAEQIPLTGVICCDTSVSAQCNWHLESHRSTLRLEVMARNGISATISPTSWVELTGQPPRPLTSGLPKHMAPEPVLDTSSEENDGDVGIAVRILGPVKIDGLPANIDRSWRLSELIVYMSFHPDGVTGEACLDALWPDKRLPQQSLSNRLSEARRSLGLSGDGQPRMKKIDGRYLLGDDVRTDWWRFQHLTAAPSDPSNWMRAMSLVRGRPFHGLAQGDWTVLEGFAAGITAAVVDLAIRLAEHHLSAGDARSAEWALRRALVVSPFDERLYRLLMRACDTLGNRAGVEGALRTLASALDWTGDPLAVVHPETARLYRELRSRSRR